MPKAASCPACGRWLVGADLRRGTFPCPDCDAPLRLATLPDAARAFVLLASGLVAFGLVNAAGVGGTSLLVGCVLLVVPVSWICATVVLTFFPRLEIARVRPEVSDVFGAGGRVWLAAQILLLPAATRDSVEQLLRVHDFLVLELEKAEAHLRAVEGQFPELARLRTIPGIGEILSPVIWSEMGSLERFRSADAFVNYTGLIPSLYESGEVSIRGGITRQGSAWLRWALVQAANAVIQGVNPFARRYRRRRRKIGNVAKTAIARSLGRCVYGVLKSGGDYQAERWGRRPTGVVRSLGAGQPEVAIGH